MDFDAGIPMSLPAVNEGPSSLDEEALWKMNLGSRKAMQPVNYPLREGEPDCSYYIRMGICRFGATCRFNHPPNRKLVSAVVVSDSTYRFNHPPNRKPAIATANMKGEYPERIGQPECLCSNPCTGELVLSEADGLPEYYLKTGTCKFGPTCKFHHPKDKAGITGRASLNVLGYPLRLSETECAYYLRTGQCKFGSTCKFHHPQPSNVILSLRGSPIYPTVHSPSALGRQSYPGGITNWPLSTTSFIPSPRWQVPLLLPQGVVSVPGWDVYSGQLGSGSSAESQQQTAGSSQIYGSLRQSKAANEGSEGTYSAYHAGSSPVGCYALQRENAFPERPGQPECQFYMKTGDCKFGAVCRFHHPRERLVPAQDCVEPYWSSFTTG